MSQQMLEEPRIQDVIDAVRMPLKCRIPRSLYSERRRMVQKSKISNFDFHPRSASRARNENSQNVLKNDTARSVRSDKEKAPLGLKRQSASLKGVCNNNNHKNKVGVPVITVPVQQKPGKTLHPVKINGVLPDQKAVKTLHPAKISGVLPDQETINQYEYMELQQSDQSNEALGNLSESDEIDPKKKQIGEISFEWTKKNDEFQKIKNDLIDRQKSVMDYYASLISIHQKMVAAGHNAKLPSTDDLHIMNVAKMTPDQLLKLCAESSNFQCMPHDKSSLNKGLAFDINRLYTMPSKLVATCERALTKRKELIDWLDSLKLQVNSQTITKKINEFHSENEMFDVALKKAKNDCIKELQEVEQYIRQRVNDTVAMHLQSETLTYRLSELNSQNADLRKQLSNAEHLRLYSNRNKYEELKKEFKEKQKALKDCLSKAEGQVRIGAERAFQLEGALDSVNVQLESKEAKIKQLQEQNEQIQRNYEEQMKGLHESVKENTANLEQIAQDREKLQVEKDDLEKKIAELSMYYKESLNNSKMELNSNVAKLAETEIQYKIEVEEKVKLESHYTKILLEAELRSKELSQKVEQLELHLASSNDLEHEYGILKNELEKARLEIESYKKLLIQQTDAMTKMEQDQQQRITELKNQEDILKSQLQDRETKMGYYEVELLHFKDYIAQLQEQFVVLEEMNLLQETVQTHKEKLRETTYENSELIKKVQKNEIQLKELSETNEIKTQQLKEKENLMNTLLKTEEERCKIIEQLSNNLEERANMISEINQQLEEKDLEIDSLASNLETRKQQILKLEKIILSLEDKARKASLLRNKYEEKINLLETKIDIYKSNRYKQGIEASSNNLDQFLKLLENEMEIPIKDCTDVNRKGRNETKNFDKIHDITRHERETSKIFDDRSTLTKHTNEISEKIPVNNDLYKGDNLDRKAANTNMNTVSNFLSQEEVNSLDQTDPDIQGKPNVETCNEKIFTSKYNIQSLICSKYQKDKKAKMFVLAGHRL